MNARKQSVQIHEHPACCNIGKTSRRRQLFGYIEMKENMQEMQHTQQTTTQTAQNQELKSKNNMNVNLYKKKEDSLKHETNIY